MRPDDGFSGEPPVRNPPGGGWGAFTAGVIAALLVISVLLIIGSLL